MAGKLLGSVTSKISKVRSSIDFGITIEDLSPVTAQRHADAVGIPGNRCEVANYKDDLARVSRFPEKTQHALLGVAAVDPFKAGRFAIQFVKRRLAAIRGIQVADPLLNLAVGIEGEQMP